MANTRFALGLFGLFFSFLTYGGHFPEEKATADDQIQIYKTSGEVFSLMSSIPPDAQELQVECFKEELPHRIILFRNNKTQLNRIDPDFKNRVDFTQTISSICVTVRSLTVNDTGNYTCDVMFFSSGEKKNDTMRARVKVTEADQTQINKTSGEDFSLMSSIPPDAQSLQVECIKEGLHQNSLFFRYDKTRLDYIGPDFKNRVDFNRINSSICVTVRSLTVNDTGNYTCDVMYFSSGEKKNDTMSARVKVTEAAEGHTWKMIVAACVVLLIVLIPLLVWRFHKKGGFVRCGQRTPEDYSLANVEP